MQRPLHARVYKPGEQLQPQPYYPFYPAVTPNGQYALYPAGATAYPLGAAPTQDLDNVLSSRPAPQPNANGSNIRPRSNSNDLYDHDQMPVYNAPVTYGPPVNAKDPPRARGRRYNSEIPKKIAHIPEPPQTVKPQYQSPINEHGIGMYALQFRLTTLFRTWFFVDHVFLSLSNVDTLKIKGTVPESLIRQEVFPLWWNGVENDYKSQDYWVVRFRGRPWTADGDAGFRGRRLVCRLFEVLGNNVNNLPLLS
jgi:hypothetical protein